MTAGGDRLLESLLAKSAAAWIQEQQAASESLRPVAFSRAARCLGKAALTITDLNRNAADCLVPGWRLDGLTADQAGRMWLVLNAPEPAAFLRQMWQGAEVDEQIALVKTLPLVPQGETLVDLARAATRSSITTVFSALAQRNPYPRRHFDQEAWNQLVLKALFVGIDLWPIQGLDERANPELARMLLDYARERHVAQRAINPELWRCAGPWLDAWAIGHLATLLIGTCAADREAAALALAASPDPAARSALAGHGDLAAAITTGEFRYRQERPSTPL